MLGCAIHPAIRDPDSITRPGRTTPECPVRTADGRHLTQSQRSSQPVLLISARLSSSQPVSPPSPPGRGGCRKPARHRSRQSSADPGRQAAAARTVKRRSHRRRSGGGRIPGPVINRGDQQNTPGAAACRNAARRPITRTVWPNSPRRSLIGFDPQFCPLRTVPPDPSPDQFQPDFITR